jgi:hypothetical protein
MDEPKLEIPNVGICLEKLERLIDQTQQCESCQEAAEEAREALRYLSFLLDSRGAWNWVECSGSNPVIRR